MGYRVEAIKKPCKWNFSLFVIHLLVWYKKHRQIAFKQEVPDGF